MNFIVNTNKKKNRIDTSKINRIQTIESYQYVRKQKKGGGEGHKPANNKMAITTY